MTMSKLGNLPSGNLCYIPKLALNYPCLSTVIWQVHVHLMMTPYWCYAWFLMLNLCPYFQTDYMVRRPQLSDQLILWKDTWTNLQAGLGWLVWEGSGIWWTFLFIFIRLRSHGFQLMLLLWQLKRELRKGCTFDGWFEGVISFPPTYKYEFDSEYYVSDESKSGRRTPAWYVVLLTFRSILVHSIVPEISTEHAISNKQTLSSMCAGVTAFSHTGRESGYFRTRGGSLHFLITALWLQSTWQRLKFPAVESCRGL